MAQQRRWTACFILVAVLLSGCGFKLNPNSLPTSVIALPFDRDKISFDDISYDAGMDRLIIPAAETGTLLLLDPQTGKVAKTVEGFSVEQTPVLPMLGATSAAVVGNLIFALDKTANTINIVDPSSGKIIGSTDTKGVPDYIRYIPTNNELWVTEPSIEKIEVFELNNDQPPSLKRKDPIDVPDGPEGLVVDQSQGMVFTNQPGVGMTAVIFVLTHSVAFHWGNGCSKARGMAVDETHQLLFVACAEGKVVVMDIQHDGAQITSQTYGGGLDFIAYNPDLHHLYLPSATSGILAVFGVTDAPPKTKPTLTPTGVAEEEPTRTADNPLPTANIRLERLATADTAVKARCVTVDSHNNVWICDPNHGRLLLVHDSSPASIIGK